MDAIPDDVLCIRDIDGRLMRQSKARVRASGCTIEQETFALIESGLSLPEANR
jgi:hypothetical protein